jgi:hypothetical protein
LHTDNEEYTVYAKLMAITAVENREQLRWKLRTIASAKGLMKIGF